MFTKISPAPLHAESVRLRGEAREWKKKGKYCMGELNVSVECASLTKLTMTISYKKPFCSPSFQQKRPHPKWFLKPRERKTWPFVFCTTLQILPFKMSTWPVSTHWSVLSRVMVFCIMPLLSWNHKIALLQSSFVEAEKVDTHMCACVGVCVCVCLLVCMCAHVGDGCGVGKMAKE